ncbi:hypothetical protein JTE90_022072 [Oedothorax gibbosus]|uniref:Uncharacterized protein n=1 Tax=Oedothorax gibbosus TaxID=931172 RepID=A0AAV6TJK2_9ARAC|nr:hypothetical protein JTE90_022072 [Oedothorax gibbosus]
MKVQAAEVGRIRDPRFPLGRAPPWRPARFQLCGSGGVLERYNTRWDPKDGELMPGRTRPEETLVEVLVAGSDVANRSSSRV